MVNRLSYFSFQPLLHKWRNKRRGMFFSVCGVVHAYKGPLAANRKVQSMKYYYLSGQTPYNSK